MGVWVYVCMDVWVYGCVNELVRGRLYACMGVCMSVCVCVWGGTVRVCTVCMCVCPHLIQVLDQDGLDVDRVAVAFGRNRPGDKQGHTLMHPFPGTKIM